MTLDVQCSSLNVADGSVYSVNINNSTGTVYPFTSNVFLTAAQAGTLTMSAYIIPGSVIQSITIPKLSPGELFFCDKLSKRRDQDISTVAAGYRLRIKGGRIAHARIAFGGMAAMPMRARAVEAALLSDGFAAAAAALEKEFKPIDDWRGTGAYRLQAAKNLLRRVELRIASPSYAVEVEAL